MEQRSEEWFAARAGKVTASRVADLMAKTKAGWGASRANYMAELISERLTGMPAPRFSSTAMQWGTDTEPQARAAYEFETDLEVSEIGFVIHPTITDAGASPDGLVGDSGLVEIKCPNTATHIDTLLNGGIPAKYQKQMLWQMACTGRAWCDFVSFDPRMPPDMQIYIERMTLEPDPLAEMESAVSDFLAEMQGKIDALTKKFREAA